VGAARVSHARRGVDGISDEGSNLTVAVDGTRIMAVGEVDYTTSGQLHHAVSAVLADNPGARIDFALVDLSFMDSSCLAVLVEAENRGAHVHVSRASSAVQLVIR